MPWVLVVMNFQHWYTAFIMTGQEGRILNEIENIKRIPQLRVLATDFCESKCIYCRDSGEGNLKSEKRRVTLEAVTKIAAAYKHFGGTEVKITGGDPVFWPDLVDCVGILKNRLKFQKVEIITRSTKILGLMDALVSVGLDILNFSLDTLNKQIYEHVTGKCDFEEYINAIKTCSGLCNCKINSVIMKSINDEEYNDIINFCADNGIKQLKFLDLIDDINLELCDSHETKVDLKPYSVALEAVISSVRSISKSEKLISQGGLGHPMNSFTLENGLEVMIKDCHSGAWYSQICCDCLHYPCHDALMALRLTPENSLQLCLLNSRKNLSFNSDNIYSVMKEALTVYQDAFFRPFIEEHCQ